MKKCWVCYSLWICFMNSTTEDIRKVVEDNCLLNFTKYFSTVNPCLFNSHEMYELNCVIYPWDDGSRQEEQTARNASQLH